MSFINELKNFLGLSNDIKSKVLMEIDLNLNIIKKLSDETNDLELKKVLDRIYSLCKIQAIEYRYNYHFLKGLIYNLEKIREDVNIYNNIKLVNKKDESNIKRMILYRLKRKELGLQNRENLLPKGFIPKHTIHNQGDDLIKDMPDWGLYDYHPINYKKSRFIELDLVHYTTYKNYSEIMKTYYNKKIQIFLMDENGWSYFLARPLPRGIPNKEARRIIGTSNQFYVGKVAPRDPEIEIIFRIKIRAERVFEKEEKYKLFSMKDLKELVIKKYAIAGGIFLEDIIKIPEAKVYINDQTLKDKFKKIN